MLQNGWSFKPIAKEDVSSRGRREVSLLCNHCLKLCQKQVVTVQFQKRWMRVSSSIWQKLQRLLSFRFIYFFLFLFLSSLGVLGRLKLHTFAGFSAMVKVNFPSPIRAPYFFLFFRTIGFL